MKKIVIKPGDSMASWLVFLMELSEEDLESLPYVSVKADKDGVATPREVYNAFGDEDSELKTRIYKIFINPPISVRIKRLKNKIVNYIEDKYYDVCDLFA